MLVSAIVPTHERPDTLRRCLETLQGQAIEPTCLEVIVIDDGSVSDIAAVVDAVAATGPVSMRCERQQLAGLNTARNRGAELARGELLAYLDDDTLVTPGWTGALLGAFADPACAAVGGRIELAPAGPIPGWLEARSYYLGAYDLGLRARWIEPGDPVPVGANCAVRRETFRALGGFVPGLDRVAGSLVSNGDTEFFRRVRRSGGRLRYEPSALVEHCIPSERLTAGYLARRHYAQGISDELLIALERRPRSSRRRREVVRTLPPELRHAVRVLARDLLAGRGTIGTRLACCYWAGRLRGAGVAVTDLPGAPARGSEPGPARAVPPPP